MKHLFSCCLFLSSLLTGYSGFAQQYAIGIRGGLSIPNLTGDGSTQNPLNTGYSSRVGADAGIFAEFKLSQLFSIQPMIKYSSQGGKKDGFQALPVSRELGSMFPPGQVPPYFYADYNSVVKLNYLMIPVLAKFGMNFSSTSPFRVYADAGPFVGFLLSAKQVTSGQSTIYIDPGGQQALPIGSQSFNKTVNIKDQLQSTNFGIEGNAGLSYSFGPGDIFMEGGFNYGFTNIQKGTDNGKNKIGTATITIGYSHWFGK
ncbi:MAG TPA: porin family protein [Agriterribacter sp.]|nr:porin family protein [Agriterribacter sp.]